MPKNLWTSKDAKKDLPLRPILDMINFSQCKIAKFLIPILSPVSIKFSNFCVKDSFSFVENLRNSPSSSDQMRSFDKKSLFTKDNQVAIC